LTENATGRWNKTRSKWSRWNRGDWKRRCSDTGKNNRRRDRQRNRIRKCAFV